VFRLLLGFIILFLTINVTGCGSSSSEQQSYLDPGAVIISWLPPLTNEDGSTLNDLAGFNVHYGQQSGIYSSLVNVGPYAICEIRGLTNGEWYFAVTAYDTSGNQSGFSEEINTIIRR